MSLKYRLYNEDINELFLALVDGDEDDVKDIRYHLEHVFTRYWSFDKWELIDDIVERATGAGGDISIFRSPLGGDWSVVEYMSKKDLIEYLHDAIDNHRIHLSSENTTFVRIPIRDLPTKKSSVKIIKVPKFPSILGFTGDKDLARKIYDELYDGVNCGFYLDQHRPSIVNFIFSSDSDVLYLNDGVEGITISIMDPVEMAEFISDMAEEFEGN